MIKMTNKSKSVRLKSMWQNEAHNVKYCVKLCFGIVTSKIIRSDVEHNKYNGPKQQYTVKQNKDMSRILNLDVDYLTLNIEQQFLLIILL